jgi:hypothetical protein
MSAFSLIQDLEAQGVWLKLSGDGANLVVPAGSLSSEQRATVLSHKAEILEFLVDARKTTTALVKAAMQVCARHNDSDVAREEMRQDCLKLPPHLQQDLLDHFTGKP